MQLDRQMFDSLDVSQLRLMHALIVQALRVKSAAEPVDSAPPHCAACHGNPIVCERCGDLRYCAVCERCETCLWFPGRLTTERSPSNGNDHQ